MQDVAAVLRREYPGGVDVAYEGVGGAMQRAALESLADGGRLLVVGYISEYPHAAAAAAPEAGEENTGNVAGGGGGSGGGSAALPPSAELFWGGRTVDAGRGRTVFGNVWPADRADTLAAKARVFRLHAEGALQAWVDDGAAFAGVAAVPDAVDYMLRGRAVGKVVVACQSGGRTGTVEHARTE